MAKILIVEDNQEILDLLKESLERDHHLIVGTQSGLSALTLFDQQPADLVLVDILLPDKDGLELIQDFRRIKPDTKIIAMSGGFKGGEIDLLTIAKRFGADRVLPKPFGIDDLLMAVHSLLEPSDMNTILTTD